MTQFKLSKSLNIESDILLPFRKSQVEEEQVVSLTGVEFLDFEGSFGEVRQLNSKKGKRIYLLGLGEPKDQARIHEAFRKFAFKTEKFWTSVQVSCQHLESSEVKEAVLGFMLNSYQIGVYKTSKESQETRTITFVSEIDLISPIAEGEATGDTINRIKQLVDAPANVKTPEYLAEWSKKSAKKYGYNCEVKDQQKLEKEGFGGLLAVGQGSAHSPVLIVTSHLPKPSKEIDVALVGKGITFDTGGLSIKPSDNLHYMKSDMGGAAAVLGAVELAARLKLNVNIVGVVASAENAVDAKSFRPSDVITSYSGKTIEIIDTDAEGRLVLADALSYVIRHHHPSKIIDLATLTGSVVRTLGYSAGGLFSNNKELSKSLMQIGELIHERLWPLPLYTDYEEDLHSDIADLRNFSGKPIAGASTAAKFLEAFTESHECWAHLDIAGVAFGSSDYAKMKSASGFGVRLLTEYLKTLS